MSEEVKKMRKKSIVHICFLTSVVGPGFASAQNTSVPPEIPSLVSVYLQEMIDGGGAAAGAVQCGFRSDDWGKTYHDKMVSLLETHAGTPGLGDAHVPSGPEKDAALAALSREEQEDIDQATLSLTQPDIPGSYCSFMKTIGTLDQLDNFETGTTSLWP